MHVCVCECVEWVVGSVSAAVGVLVAVVQEGLTPPPPRTRSPCCLLTRPAPCPPPPPPCRAMRPWRRATSPGSPRRGGRSAGSWPPAATTPCCGTSGERPLGVAVQQQEQRRRQGLLVWGWAAGAERLPAGSCLCSGTLLELAAAAVAFCSQPAGASWGTCRAVPPSCLPRPKNQQPKNPAHPRPTPQHTQQPCLPLC